MFSDRTELKVGEATSVKVMSGDISRVDSDALITAINSGGMWFGGIDGVIQRQAGDHFHQQARKNDLVDGMAIVARGKGTDSSGSFKNVVFVVDDLKKPLHQILCAGLEAADKAGFEKVSLPTIRMGVMRDAVEKTPQEAAGEMARGVKEFIVRNPQATLKEITFVVFRDQQTLGLLGGALKEALKS